MNRTKKIPLRGFAILTLLLGFNAVYASNMDPAKEKTMEQKNIASRQVKIKTIRGRVIDNTGTPLVGVAVVVDGTNTAAITDIDGNWTLETPENATITFSCMGFMSETMSVVGRTTFELTMKEDTQLLDEVVVVGYGTQKKANITGAVTAIDFGKEIEKRSVLNTSAALAGMAPGMTVMQGSGQPGSESTKIKIRGVGSFGSGSSSPLVLVDGVEWDMNNVNPNDISSISVLKDASSTAIYGTRAANGVILITTKNGVESKPRISYSYKGIFQEPYNNLGFVSDYADYMELFNEGCFNAGVPNKFSQTSIDLWKKAKENPNGLNENGVPNYVAYPNTDWFSEIFDLGYSQEHNLSVSGGSKKVKYLISMGYLDNQGIMNRFNLDSSTQKVNFRTNLEADVTKWFTIGTKIYGQLQQYGNANVSNGFSKLYITTPGIWPGNEDGWGKPASSEENPTANNIFAHMAGGTGTKRTWRINGTVFAKIKPYKGVSIEGTFNYSPTFGENHTYSRPVTYWNYVTDQMYSTSSLTNATVNNSFNRSYRASTELLARYDGKINDHSFGAILGYSALMNKSWGWGLKKMGATDWTLNDLSTYETLVDDSSKSMAAWGLRSFFGRLTYSYKDRYMVEANLRVDGSSKFGINNRYGVFPSFSAGWNIHEEPFMSNSRGWLDRLKLRASWGQTGSNAGIGNYAWQATYNTGNVVVNGNPSTGLYIASMSNPNLKWETTTTTDVGIDAAFLNSRLTAEFDYYFRNTTDILFTPSTYLTMGNVSQVPSNLGSMWNQGVELAINWKDTVGQDFYYWAGVNFSFNANKVTSFKGPHVSEWQEGKYVNNIKNVSENWGGPGKLCEGHEIGEHYLQSLYRGNGKGYTGGGVDINAGPVDGKIGRASCRERV